MCSETSPPRLSFSSDHTTPNQENQPRRDTSLLDLNCDFEFSINSDNFEPSSTADELFSHGMILPIQPRDTVFGFASKEAQSCEAPLFSSSLASLPPLPSTNDQVSKKEKRKENSVLVSCDLDQKSQSTKSSSFWGFKRSSSLNSESKRSLLCSLPLLSRSNSTGSAPNPKKNSQKQQFSIGRSTSSSSSSSFTSNPYPASQKPPLKKSYGGSYGNGVRIIPVLNVPPPYISKGTGKLFGFSSFLNGKDKKSKK
ncbi:hypothetical protein UlMin_045415 [Ulmus minor]